jgi:hypothetical protein
VNRWLFAALVGALGVGALALSGCFMPPPYGAGSYYGPGSYSWGAAPGYGYGAGPLDPGFAMPEDGPEGWGYRGHDDDDDD